MDELVDTICRACANLHCAAAVNGSCVFSSDLNEISFRPANYKYVQLLEQLLQKEELL